MRPDYEGREVLQEYGQLKVVDMFAKYGFSLLFVLVLNACAGTPDPSDNVVEEGYHACPQTRPEVCTAQYLPVCGVYTDGKKADFSNSCNACADGNVVAWVDDACNQ